MGKGGKGGKEVSDKKAAKVGLVEKNGALNPTFAAVLGEIFRRFDKDRDGAFSDDELETFARASGTGNGIDAEERKQLRNFFNCNSKGHLTLKGFEEMYLMQSNHDPKDTWKDLETLGYKKPLALLDPDSVPKVVPEEVQKARMAEMAAALAELKLDAESAGAHRRVANALDALGRAEAAARSHAKADELEGKAPSTTVDEQD